MEDPTEQPRARQPRAEPPRTDQQEARAAGTSPAEEHGPETVVFTEVQRSTGWWHWLVVALALLSVVGILLWLVWWIKPGNVLPNIAVLLPAFIVIGLVAVPLATLKLTTRITDQAIYVRLSPPPLYRMHPSRIPWTSVRQAYVREYHEFKEYGGFGIRYATPSIGDAITLNAHTGLQLELTNGKKLLISTRRPDELEAVLAGLKGRGLTAE